MVGRRVIPWLVVVSALTAGGCGLVRTLTGTNLDAEQFSKAREAKVLQVRLQKANEVAQRLQAGSPYNSGSMTIQISETFLNSIAQWYAGRTGWLDRNTKYTVDTVNVELHNGCASASLGMRAWQDTYGVEMRLVMDCLLDISKSGKDLTIELEPYNISPAVSSTGFLVGTGTMIENIVKMKVGSISKDFPPLKVPLNFENTVQIDNQQFPVREKINLDVSIPRRLIDYSFSIGDVLILKEAVFVSLQLTTAEVR